MRLIKRIFWYCLSFAFFHKFVLSVNVDYLKWGDVLESSTCGRVVVTKKLKEEKTYIVGIVPLIYKNNKYA